MAEVARELQFRPVGQIIDGEQREPGKTTDDSQEAGRQIGRSSSLTDRA